MGHVCDNQPALHAASSYPGAQFYMECAQLQITGGTGAKTPSTVSFPGAYHGTDPGIKLSIYYPPVTNYTIPGEHLRPLVFRSCVWLVADVMDRTCRVHLLSAD